ncbi:MAG: hypothetical protein AUK35_03055 [Zetaproteobacteria bacterium CG2_30_46_52]|nr:MAG: hypothetical protein AUK35_03055 [Zetaproteobacteria bacterium CG2_30_46_52]
MKVTNRDSIFIAVILIIVLTLVLGAKERTTKAVPDDATHKQVTSREACMSCHSAEGIHPQPMGHPKANQCFQCHKQPEHWVGPSK